MLLESALRLAKLQLSRSRAGEGNTSEGRVMLFWPRFLKAISLFLCISYIRGLFTRVPLFSTARRCDLRLWDRPPHPLFNNFTPPHSLPKLPPAPTLPPFPPSASVSLLGSLSSAVASSLVGPPHLSSSSQTTRRRQRIGYRPIMNRVGRRAASRCRVVRSVSLCL